MSWIMQMTRLPPFNMSQILQIRIVSALKELDLQVEIDYLFHV